jgi:hypothetical protein
MNAVMVVAVFGFCVCATNVSFGQTTQPRREGPEQQAPPEDSPEPLGNARRMYRGLFGGANTGPRRETTLSFTGSVSEVYGREDVDEGEPELAGLYTNFIGDLDYGRYGSRTQMVATGGANLRYYSQQSEFLAANYHAGVGVGTRVAPQTTIRIGETVTYGPAALPWLLPEPLPPELGGPLPPDNNFAVTNDKAVGSATTATVEHGFSVRSQLSASGSYRYTNYLAEDVPTSDWSTLHVGVFYRRRITSTRSIRTGYNYRRASYTVPEAPDGRGPQPAEHNLFIGVTVDHAFSEQQRTMVSLEGGPSLFNFTARDLDPSSDRLRFVFAAAVAHQIGSSWLLAASFDRGSQFNRGYGGPVYADEFYASATGFLNARTDVTASVAHAQADRVLGVEGRRFITTSAGASFRYALSRTWAVEGRYFHYSYDFTESPGIPILLAVPERFSRHSVRGGVSVFVPISPR